MRETKKERERGRCYLAGFFDFKLDAPRLSYYTYGSLYVG